MKLLSNQKVKLWFGTITGIRSHGLWGRRLSEILFQHKKESLQEGSFHISNITYGYLWATMCIIPWVRKIVIEYLSARLSIACLKYPKARKVLLLHSYSTWAVLKGMLRFPGIYVDTIILVGCIAEDDYPWNAMVEADRVKEVYNFIGKRDLVPFFARWLFGGAGRWGFQQLANGKVRNIIRRRWGHRGFLEAIDDGTIEKIIDGKGNGVKSDEAY